MKRQNATLLITGANRVIGLAFARKALARGARKVYCGAHNPASVNLPDVEASALDVNNAEQVDAPARQAGAEEELPDEPTRRVKRSPSAELSVYLRDTRA